MPFSFLRWCKQSYSQYVLSSMWWMGSEVFGSVSQRNCFQAVKQSRTLVPIFVELEFQWLCGTPSELVMWFYQTAMSLCSMIRFDRPSVFIDIWARPFNVHEKSCFSDSHNGSPPSPPRSCKDLVYLSILLRLFFSSLSQHSLSLIKKNFNDQTFSLLSF